MCPNCGKERPCGCIHDGNDPACKCEFCSQPPTEDISAEEIEQVQQAQRYKDQRG